jgi:isoquinoline 1-oxidoreductase subunit beta
MTLSRRRFLQVSATGSGMLLGFSLLGCKSETKQPPSESEAPAEPAAGPGIGPGGEPVDLNAWVRIDSDDTVTFTVSQSEMGQGVLTAFAMILAEELGADWSKVRAQHAPADESKYGNQSTGGSTSVRGNYETLRKVGAAAREMLVAAAASRFGVDAGECRAADSVVSHAASGKRARYGELAKDAATVPTPDAPRLTEAKDFRLIGKPIKRLDTPSKVNGSAVYGIDVKVPGMLVAQVVHSPYPGGQVASFDASEATKVPGVREVVQIPTGVAVVADHFWAASKGRAALKVEWSAGDAAKLSNASIEKVLRAVVTKGKPARIEGEPDKALAKATRKLKAVYRVPYLAHAPMEPLNCTVDLQGDRCDVWVSTQSPTRTQATVAEITGLPKESVVVHNAMLGGGFGRRAQVDFVIDAAHVAKAVGKPVKVIWTREDDIRGWQYRPVAYNELSGAVDAEGWPSVWIHRIASPSVLEHLGMTLKDGIDGTSIEGASNLPYAIANLQVTYAKPELPVATWFWRSVGSSQNAYVTECFLDELARLGGKDPLEVRRRLLANAPRHLRVLEAAAEKAGWGSPLPEGRARGLAVHECFGSLVAQVAEVSVDGGRVRVHRVVCAVDCGDVINPDTIAAQMESSIAYGLSAALYGKIDLAEGKVVQSNFHDYPVLRMPEMPAVETHIVATGDPIGGIGEPGLPPIAPAVCNALLVLTGKPVRALPIGSLS